MIRKENQFRFYFGKSLDNKKRSEPYGTYQIFYMSS